MSSQQTVHVLNQPYRIPFNLQAWPAIIGCILLIAYQLGLLRIFFPLLSGFDLSWRVAYYGFWLATLSVATLALVADRTLLLKATPVLVFTFFCLSLISMHEIGTIEKNYIVAMGIVAAVTILALASNPIALLRFSAAVTTLFSFVCLAEMPFPDGFTTADGRAAGFGVNPNVAAAMIVLGYSASVWALPRWVKAPFAVLTVAATAATLSRSTLLVLMAVIAFQIVGAAANGLRSGIRLKVGRSVWASVALAMILSVWFVFAMAVNDRIPVAAAGSFNGLTRLSEAVTDALASVEAAVKAAGPRKTGASVPGQVNTGVLERNELVAVAQEQEGTNSAASRALLLKLAWLSYLEHPQMGRGLEAAHALAPHNSFLLFPIAFGHIGWVVPFGFLALAVCYIRRWEQGAYPLGLAGLLFFSHDVLIFPGMLMPITLAQAALIASSKHSGDQYPDISRAIIKTSWAGLVLFAAGTLALHLWYTDRTIGQIDKETIIAGPGLSYHAPYPASAMPGMIRLGVSSEPPGKAPRMMEDGVPLPGVPARVPVVEAHGAGLFAIWRRTTLVLSASNNSDPRTNGRDYALDSPASVHPLMLAVMAAMLVWCAILSYCWRPTTGWKD